MPRVNLRDGLSVAFDGEFYIVERAGQAVFLDTDDIGDLLAFREKVEAVETQREECVA